MNKKQEQKCKRRKKSILKIAVLFIILDLFSVFSFFYSLTVNSDISESNSTKLTGYISNVQYYQISNSFDRITFSIDGRKFRLLVRYDNKHADELAEMLRAENNLITVVVPNHQLLRMKLLGKTDVVDIRNSSRV